MKINLLFFVLVCIAFLFSCATPKVNAPSIEKKNIISQTNVTDTTNEDSAIPTDSSTSALEIINSSLNNTFLDKSKHTPLTLYRVLNYKGDTTLWKSCHIEDSTFSCNNTHETPSCGTYSSRFSLPVLYRIEIYDTTFINLNFGKDAITNYIPMARIPEFDRDSVANLFSSLPGEPCTHILFYSSNYSLEPIGLPDDFMMKEINYIKDYQYYANKINDNTGNEVCSVAYKPEYYTRTSFGEIDDCEVNIKSIPEEKYYYTYQFLNVSLRSYKGSTLTWKLVYKDQYGRGDTLDITTKFE